MTIQQALIERPSSGMKFSRVEQPAVEALAERGVPYTTATTKMIDRNQVMVTPDTLVIGSIPMVHAGLKQLGIQPPLPNDYPEVLAPYFHRRIWRARLRDATSRAVFVKPYRLKRFTGRVLYGYDPFLVNYASQNTEVWASDVVTWLTEWRFFVVNGNLVGGRPYDGDPNLRPDPAVVEQAVHLMGRSVGGYALDFGVLSTGETALVEMNHGYSLDHYGLDPSLYLDVLEAFWTLQTSTPG